VTELWHISTYRIQKVVIEAPRHSAQMTLSTSTFSITTFSIMGLVVAIGMTTLNPYKTLSIECR